MADYVNEGLRRIGISISRPMLAIVCIIFGVMVVVFPNLLVWIVGLFLVIQGVLLLTDILEYESQKKPVTASAGFYCAQCGTRNIDEATFCKKCGQKLKQYKQKKS